MTPYQFQCLIDGPRATEKRAKWNAMSEERRALQEEYEPDYWDEIS